ncbi:MAG: hypothetical protein EBV02_06165 [Actinobacteria bacterium]|nr:hypothetical protein [Actinomycetota bacterium]NDC47122.1 hypothetical protein [Actinomycetota bacterium]NDE67612.1 hypothetical protein [Actinomycetota bacterium]
MKGDVRMFLNVTDRRRITLVGLLTLVTVPAVLFFTRGEPQAEVATVAAAGVSVAGSGSETSEPPTPVFLEGPAGIAPTGTAVISYPSSQGSRLEGKGTFSSFNGAPQTVCNAPGAPYGVTIVVKNLDNGRSIACSNVMMPSTPANVVIVLHTRLFVELSDLVNAPIPVALTW